MRRSQQKEFTNFDGDIVDGLQEIVNLRNSVSPFKLGNYPLVELLNIFPEAEKIIKKKMLAEVKQCEVDLKEAQIYRNKFEDIIVWSDNQDFHRMVCEEVYLKSLIEGRAEKIRKYSYYLAPKSEQPTGGVSKQDISIAKNVPVSSFLEIRSKKAICPWHADTNPSLTIYKESNTVWCFACNSGGDSIELVRKLHNLDFVSAVKFINR